MVQDSRNHNPETQKELQFLIQFNVTDLEKKYLQYKERKSGRKTFRIRISGSNLDYSLHYYESKLNPNEASLGSSWVL